MLLARHSARCVGGRSPRRAGGRGPRGEGHATHRSEQRAPPPPPAPDRRTPPPGAGRSRDEARRDGPVAFARRSPPDTAHAGTRTWPTRRRPATPASGPGGRMRSAAPARREPLPPRSSGSPAPAPIAAAEQAPLRTLATSSSRRSRSSSRSTWRSMAFPDISGDAKGSWPRHSRARSSHARVPGRRCPGSRDRPGRSR